MKQRLVAMYRRLPFNLAAFLSVVFLGALVTDNADAVYFPPGIKTGEVLARTVVLSEAGNPIFVVFNSEGKIAEEIGEAAGGLEDAFILSVGTYNAYVERMNDYLSDKDGVGKGSYLMTRDDFLGAEFKTLDEKHILKKPNLRPDTVAVVVRGKETLLSKDDNPLMMEAPINLFGASLQSNTLRSMLINKEGEAVKITELNIGFKAEYYKDPETRKEPLGPVPGIVIQGGFYALGGEPGSVTDERGKYTFGYVMPPCPGFTFEYTTNIFAKVYYKNFNPRGQKFGTYHMMRQGWDFCNGLADVAPGLTLGGLMAQVNAIAIRAASAIPIQRNTFSIDVYMIAGNAIVSNPDGQNVAFGDKTEYGYEQPDFASIIHNYDEDGDGTPDVGYDFDGDGKQEKILLGNLVWNEEKKRDDFVANGDGKYQGVYLSSGSRSPESEDLDLKQPDFTRIRDRKADFEHQGLLTSVSEEDLKKTDLYIFRESNGQLVTERRGLKTEELFNDGGFDEGKQKIFYRVMVRGAQDAGNPLRGKFEDWQAKAKMEPEFYKRNSDHLRPGENIRIILINRQTGYIGSLTTPLKNINEGGYGAISFPIAEIKLLPPNLSVRVERRKTIEQGLTKDEEREYQVGYEGGALASDSVIEIFTEWYDQDGRPLPEGLGEYGYTGRLAKIVAANELAPEGGDLANFTIKPGKNRQVLRVKDEAITREHYYVHVHGESKNNNPDFATLGAGAGKLQSRPAHYVPFKVAIFDEKATIIARNAWRRAREEGQVTGRFPLPAYRWLYRPEMQFSLFDLQMKKILHGADGQEGQDILTAETPGLSNVDDFVNLSYNLLVNDIAPLPLLGEERELLFAVGEQEILATMGSDQQLRFRNLNHLASLQPEDFLTMRLYFNHDPENVLWEFAFEYLALNPTIVGSPQQGSGLFRVSADDPELPLVSWLVGYSLRDPKYKSPKTLRWASKGVTPLFAQQESDQNNAVFTTTVKMPRTAGSRTTVQAIMEGNPDIIAEWGEIVVVPGEPYTLNTDVDGEMHIEGYKNVTVDLKSWDKYNNKVSDGTQISYEVIGAVNIVSKNDHFTNGSARIVLAGSSLVDPEAKLKIRVGELTREIPLQVKPLNVTWEELPSEFHTKQTYNLAVKVETDSGEPAVGVDVIFDSTFGRFERGVPQTGSDGVAHIQFYTGLYDKEGRLSARVGLQEAKHKQAKPTFATPVKADTSETILVGDATSDGVAEYVRYDGMRIGVPYKAQAKINVRADVGTQHNLSIGSLSEPNREPIAAYHFNELIGDITPDETGLHDGRAENATTITDHPLGIGTSYYFAENTKVQVVAKPSMQPIDGLGFRVDVKPYAAGDIVKLGAGAHKLQYTGDNRFTFSVMTSDGEVTISSGPVSSSEWHSVAARVFNGQLEMEIDGQAQTPIAIASPLTYGFGVGMEFGGFLGLLSSYSHYDWRTAPLVQFGANGSEHLLFTVTAGEGGNQVEVQSKGNLNTAQSESLTRTLRVGLTIADENHYISLIDKEFYGQLMGTVAANSNTAPPVPDGGAWGSTHPKHLPIWDTVFPVANAGLWDWISENAWDAFTATVGVLIPFNEARGLFEQIGYMMNGEWDKVNYVTLTLDAIGVLTFIPVAKPLKLILTPLRRFIGPLGNKPFIKAIGGIIAKYADKIRKGKFDDLYKLVPYFLIVGELASDEEGRTALLTMVDGIESADDFLVWVDYLSLPALGWDGDGEPPAIDTDAPPVTDVVAMTDFNYQLSQPQFMDGVVPRAYAAPGALTRIGGAVLKKFLKAAKNTKALQSSSKELTSVMKGLREALVEGGNKSLRGMAFNPRLLVASLRKGLGNSAFGVTALLTGKSNARLHHGMIIGLFAYLEDRMNNCAVSIELGIGDTCKPIPELSPFKLPHGQNGIGTNTNFHKEIDGLISKVVLLAAKNPVELGEEDGAEESSEFATFIKPWGHGALWHLAMIAVHHAKYEVSGTEPLAAIERLAYMDLYQSKNEEGELQVTSDLASGRPLRYIDIELDLGQGEKTKWVEIKSLSDAQTASAKKAHDCKWAPWVMLVGDKYADRDAGIASACRVKSVYSKQFFLDARAVSEFSAASLGKQYAGNMDWWLQKFQVKQRTFRRKGTTYTIRAERSFSKPLFKDTVSTLQKISEPKAALLNLGSNPPTVSANSKLIKESYINNHFHQFSLYALIKDELKDKLLKDLPQTLINEMQAEELADE